MTSRRVLDAKFCARVACGVALLALGFRADVAHAGLLIVAPTNVAAAQGSSDPVNFFEVVLVADDNMPLGPFDVNGFNVRLVVDAATGITFTRATIDTATPYAFASVATLGFSDTVSAGGTIVDFADFGLTAADLQTVASGDTFGLGRVFFNVSSSAPVAPPLVTILIDSASDVVDPNGISFGGSRVDGGIRVVGGVAVIPEPSALTLAGIAFALCGAALARKRHRLSAGSDRE